ncbi:MAG: hypothetical protein AB7L65_04695 [Hyphomonadaceae bacterium]
MTADTVKIVIHPSGADADLLSVADAMQQVLDYFALLAKAEARDPTSDLRVIWRLESASTNSPLTIEATPVSSSPEFPVDRQAAQAKFALATGLKQLLQAETKPAWIDDEAEGIVHRILARNMNGIGKTEFFPSSDQAPLVVDARTALRAENFLQVVAATEAAKVVDLTRREHGSIEGYVSTVTTHYGKPAITLRERLSRREVKCVLSGASAEKIGREHNWTEAWTGRRILVSGSCHYDRSGQLTQVDAEEINRIGAANVKISDIRDPTFSDGLGAAKHLELIRGKDG